MKFALAIYAKRSTKKELQIQIKAAYTPRAVSEAEATGIGIALAKEEWPQSDGWEDHNCQICEVPK